MTCVYVSQTRPQLPNTQEILHVENYAKHLVYAQNNTEFPSVKDFMRVLSIIIHWSNQIRAMNLDLCVQLTTFMRKTNSFTIKRQLYTQQVNLHGFPTCQSLNKLSLSRNVHHLMILSDSHKRLVTSFYVSFIGTADITDV